MICINKLDFQIYTILSVSLSTPARPQVYTNIYNHQAINTPQLYSTFEKVL